MPSQKPKPKKPGRPPLPKGNAKVVMLRVRVTPEEHKAIADKAKFSKQKISEWIRSALNAATER